MKYTAGRPNPKVSVTVVAQGPWAELRVVDTGIGMSEETLQSLFQPFFRAAEARTRPGHGLGMATAKRIVEAYGGTIAVQSVHGEGTTVTVRLPLAEATATSTLPAPTPLLAPAAEPPHPTVKRSA